MRTKIICLNCRQSRHNHGRGLCTTCYRMPRIRCSFRSMAKEDIDDRVPENVPADSLACVAYPRCTTFEKVAPGFREDRVSIGCPWVVCDKCKIKIADMGDD